MKDLHSVHCLIILCKKKIFRECQSGFIPGNLSIAQLLSITHEISKNFDCNVIH